MLLLLVLACGLSPFADSAVPADCASRRAFYRDADGDGAGDPSEVWVGCEAAEGWVETGGDCDDADPARAEDCSRPADSGVDTGGDSGG